MACAARSSSSRKSGGRWRSGGGCVRRASGPCMRAAPNSVTTTSTSLRAVVTGPAQRRPTILLSRRPCAVAGSAMIEAPPGERAAGAHEVDLPADPADVVARRSLGIDLAGEVHLQRRVDRDEPRSRAEHVRRRGCSWSGQCGSPGCGARSRTAARRADQRAVDGDARHRSSLCALVIDAALDQVDQPVAEHPGMHAEVLAVATASQDRFGHRADADLQCRAVAE